MTTGTQAAAGPVDDAARGGVVILLVARPARRREPSATVWRLLAYDPATRTPVADIAQRWQPAGAPIVAGPAALVPAAVADFVTAVLGPRAAIGPTADAWAGPHSWHVHNAGHLRAERPGAVSPR